MIRLTRLNGKEFFVNAELVKFVEAKPDTLLTMLDGDKVHARETPQQVVKAIIAYRRFINRPSTPENWERTSTSTVQSHTE